MSSKRTITLGISPCPNDTFIFDALLHNKLEECPFEFDVHFRDVQTLNEMACDKSLDVLKISYGNVVNVLDNYSLLYSGGAMGYGCGPLLLSNTSTEFDESSQVFLPGKFTTAAALFHFWISKTGRRSGTIDYLFFDDLYKSLKCTPELQGVVIHESRFTYAKDGLFCVQDLGEFWESQTQLPIPLGGIVINNSIRSEAEEIDHWIRKSIEYAQSQPVASNSFIKRKAQIDDDAVVQAHIETYVNDFSMNIGEKGREAIQLFLATIEPDKTVKLSEILAY